MSRTPVRQALFQLQLEGYVEVLFRSGWRVLPFDFDQFEQLCDLHHVHLARQGVVGANTGLRVQQADHFAHRRFQHRQYGGSMAAVWRSVMRDWVAATVMAAIGLCAWLKMGRPIARTDAQRLPTRHRH